MSMSALRVCVLTGRTWWPLAPADTHTRAKCSTQQGECYGKYTPLVHTPDATYGPESRGSGRQLQLPHLSTRLMTDSFHNLRFTTWPHSHPKKAWIQKTNVITPACISIVIISLAYISKQSRIITNGYENVGFSYNMTRSEVGSWFLTQISTMFTVNKNHIHIQKRFEEEEFLQLSEKVLSRRVQWVCYENTDSEKEVNYSKLTQTNLHCAMDYNNQVLLCVCRRRLDAACIKATITFSFDWAAACDQF